jgi:hypothetical protein
MGKFQLHLQMKGPFAARLRSLAFNSLRIMAAEKVSAFVSRNDKKTQMKRAEARGGQREELPLWP